MYRALDEDVEDEDEETTLEVEALRVSVEVGDDRSDSGRLLISDESSSCRI